MDAKVHLVHPVHYRDAEEMFGLVRPVHRQTTAVESVGLGADLVVAVRRHCHNFRESSPVQVRDFHPWASADAEPVGYPEHLATQRLAASADPEQVARAVGEVVDHPAQVRLVAALLEAARLAVAKVRQAVVMAAEWQAS